MGEVAPISVAHAQDLMREITNFRSLLNQLELDLRRVRMVEKEYINKETGERELRYEEIKFGKQRITDEGIHDIITELRSYLNPNSFYSYTNEEDFKRMAQQGADSFAIRLWAKRKDWEVEPTDYGVICAMVRDIRELALRKAIKGNFADFTSSSSSRQENIIVESSQKTGGLLGGIFGSSQKPPR